MTSHYKKREKINTTLLYANILVAGISAGGIWLNQKQAFMYTCEIETPLVGCLTHRNRSKEMNAVCDSVPLMCFYQHNEDKTRPSSVAPQTRR